jgi:hypothetical protein
MSKYELSLSSDYVPNWTIVDAVREFFQNALDQQTMQKDNEMFFHYDGVHMIQIGNKSSVLSAKTLLLGTSTKRDDKNTIGQFGEGYKVATLVALREGKKVVFYNYGKLETWKPRMVKSRKYEGAEVLTFVTDKFFWNRPPNNNLTIVIDGITQKEWEDIKESNLHCQLPEDMGEILQTRKGRILLNPRYKGRMYVNGLFVCTTKYAHGYDFLPQYLKLDRDRKLVSDWDLQWLASEMWAASGSDKIAELAKQNAPDVAHIQWHTITSAEPTIVAYENFRAQHGDKAVPVTGQSQVDALKKASPQANAIIVSESSKHLIMSCSDYKDQPEKPKVDVGSPMEQLMTWFEDVEPQLSSEQIEAFQEIYAELLQVEDGEAPF